jgi:general secretion pathway protein D
VKLTSLYIGLVVLIAGILFLGAQDQVPTADPAAQQETLITNLSVQAVQSNAAGPATTAAEQPPAEKPPEVSKQSAAAGFEIDRGNGSTGAATSVTTEESGKLSPKEEPVKIGRKGKKRSFWERISGSSEESKEKAGKDQMEEKKIVTPADALAAQEEVRRQAHEVEGLIKLDEANQAFARSDYETALKLFDEALSILPARPHTYEARQRAKATEAECVYRLALKAYREDRIEDARNYISSTLEYCPGHAGAARLAERIRTDEMRKIVEKARPVPPRKEAQYVEKEKLRKERMLRGQQYMALKEYDAAENEFKKVLVDEKLDADASANLKKIAEERFDLETDEFKRVKAEMLAQIRDTWTPPVKIPYKSEGIIPPITKVMTTARMKLMEKLKEIVIPEFTCNNADINAIIKILHNESLAIDRKRYGLAAQGVNFVYSPGRLTTPAGTPSVPGQKTEADILNMEEKPVEGAEAVQGGTITLNLRVMPLKEILDTITSLLSMKYEIEDNAVVIHPANVAYGKLERREWNIGPATIDTLLGGAAGAAAGGEAEITTELRARALAGTERRNEEIKQFFIGTSVPFPQGTSLTYIPAQSKLIVVNTPENLEALDGIISQINVPIDLVEIEARFVEINQTDLEELGLEWLLTDNWELAVKNGTLPPSMRERIQMNKNDFTKGLRNLSSIGDQVTAVPGGAAAGIVSISSILTNPELTVILHALEMQTGANLLSAPKVTTRSGMQAEIQVIERLKYPANYEVRAENFGTTSSGNQSLIRYIIVPSEFDEEKVGVILAVEPTVSADKTTIELKMNPQVVELSTWKDYGYDSPTVDPTHPQHVALWQPIFRARTITTQISIWDGETVVMGGLINEVQYETEDKVPFLGDIPLLGYLFRSTTKQSVKKNLLIFVTANLVDPAGIKLKAKKTVSTSVSGVGAGVTTASP